VYQEQENAKRWNITGGLEQSDRMIDFHNHYYPPEYMKAIEQGPSAVRIDYDAEGNPQLHYPGDYNIAVRGHRDIAYRAEFLRNAPPDQKIDTQVITLTTPGTHIEEPRTAIKLAQITNDAFARAVSDYPGLYVALATLPLCDPAASVTELRRAMEQLHFRGAMVFSNINGTALSHQRFWPVWEAANQLGAIIHIHPTNPVGVEAMLDYWLMPLVGFLMDTTLAAASLVFSGVPERFPNIKWVLGHLGGAIPYLAERLDRGYEAFADCRRNISRPPSSYLEKFFFDTVNFDPRALELAVSFAGASQVLAGSDYPHQIGSIPKMLQSLHAMRISDSDRQLILGGNAKRLLGI
jgi:aminocarboxymuconate-semialdehyde decarboxylase